MLATTHLTTSRHGLYYFRFPIPARLHPQHKQLSIRLSLNTRCPKEALQLVQLLRYAGDNLLRYGGIKHMNYQAIRDLLHQHFKDRLEQHQQAIASYGALPAINKTALQNSHAFAVDALKRGDYSFVGSDEDMGRLIDAYALPIKPETKEYGMLRTEFLKAFRDYCSAALDTDKATETYDFSMASPAFTKAVKAKPKKLIDAVETYCKEKLRLKQWRQHVERDYRSQFNLLLEYLGQDASLHISSDVASDVKNMLLRMPKNRNKGKLGKLTLAEQLEVQDAQRLSAVTISKHLVTYSTFYSPLLMLHLRQ